MSDYRDPKVTKQTGGGGMGKWIGIALAIIVVVLLLAWLFGLFGGDEVAVESLEPATTVEDSVVEGAPLEGAADTVEQDETPVEVENGEEVESIEVEGDAVVEPVE